MQRLAVPDAASASYAAFRGHYDRLYWTNYVGPIPTPPQAVGSDFYTVSVPFISRLITGYITEGYDGQVEDTLNYTHIPTVMTYFIARKRLVHETGQAPPVHLHNDGITIVCAGAQIYDLPDGNVFGTQFTITARFEIPIETTRG